MKMKFTMSLFAALFVCSVAIAGEEVDMDLLPGKTVTLTAGEETTIRCSAPVSAVSIEKTEGLYYVMQNGKSTGAYYDRDYALNQLKKLIEALSNN